MLHVLASLARGVDVSSLCGIFDIFPTFVISLSMDRSFNVSTRNIFSAPGNRGLYL